MTENIIRAKIKVTKTELRVRRKQYWLASLRADVMEEAAAELDAEG